MQHAVLFPTLYPQTQAQARVPAGSGTMQAHTCCPLPGHCFVRAVKCSSLNSVCFYITGIVIGHTAAAVLNDAVYALANT